jgi:hypothetical protein
VQVTGTDPVYVTVRARLSVAVPPKVTVTVPGSTVGDTFSDTCPDQPGGPPVSGPLALVDPPVAVTRTLTTLAEV